MAAKATAHLNIDPQPAHIVTGIIDIIIIEPREPGRLLLGRR